MACHQEERRPDRNNHRLVCRTKPRGRDRGTLKRAKKRGTGGSKEDESREKSISCWKEGSRSKDISFERRGVSSMLPRPEATTKDPSTDTNVAYFFFFSLLFTIPLLSPFFLLPFSPSFSLSFASSLVKSSGSTISRRKWSLQGDRRVHWKAPWKKRLYYKLRYKVSVLARLFVSTSADRTIRRHPVARGFNWFASRIVFLQFQRSFEV